MALVNLAPYSFFNAICYRPPTVMFASGAGTADDGNKDSLRNVETTGEFVLQHRNVGYARADEPDFSYAGKRR